MRRKFPRLALAPFATSLILLFVNASPAQTAPDESKQPGSVAGRVTLGGRPAAETEVIILTTEWTPQRKPTAKAKTDEEGRYRLEGVPPGRYYVSVVSPGYVLADSPLGDSLRGKLVNVLAGDELEGLDFELTRGGVVTGRVLYPEGKPAVEQYVALLPADEKLRNLRTHASLFFPTDDRGVYRAWGVLPGRYFVYAGRPKDGDYAGSEVESGGFYPQTFYPSVAEESQAKALEVSAGGVIEDVDITLGKRRRTYKASGRVVDEDGRPLKGIFVELSPLTAEGKEWGTGLSGLALTDERGEFRATGLTTGRWGVWGRDGEPFEGQQGTTYGEASTFEVADKDVSGLEVRMYRGATVSGGVVIEGTSDPAVLARRAEMKLSAQVGVTPGAALTPSSWARFSVKPDGTFQVTGMRPGRVFFNLDWPLIKGFSLHSVRRDGVEITGGLEVRKGEQVGGVQVVLAYGTSVVRGQVEFRGRARPAGARIGVRARRAGTSQFTAGSILDELGRFVIEGLSAGEYELHLMDYTLPDVPEDKRRLAKQTVNVPEGGELKVTLVHDASAAPKENEQ